MNKTRQARLRELSSAYSFLSPGNFSLSTVFDVMEERTKWHTLLLPIWRCAAFPEMEIPFPSRRPGFPNAARLHDHSRSDGNMLLAHLVNAGDLRFVIVADRRSL
jgi:hypothetical protein